MTDPESDGPWEWRAVIVQGYLCETNNVRVPKNAHMIQVNYLANLKVRLIEHFWC